MPLYLSDFVPAIGFCLVFAEAAQKVNAILPAGFHAKLGNGKVIKSIQAR